MAYDSSTGLYDGGNVNPTSDGGGGGWPTGNTTPPPPSFLEQIQSMLGDPGSGTFYDNLAKFNKQLGTLDFGNIDPSTYQGQLTGLGDTFSLQNAATQGNLASLLSGFGGLQDMARLQANSSQSNLQQLLGLPGQSSQQQLAALQAITGNLSGLGQDASGQNASYQQALAALLPRLQGLQQNVTGGLASQTSQRLDPIYQRLAGIGLGGNDPRFAQYAQGQMGLLEAQKAQDLRRVNEAMASRGLTGSTLALNEQNKVGSQYDLQARSLIGNLGMQQLGREDQSLLGAANIAQSQTGTLAGLFGQGAGMLGQEQGIIGQGSQTAGQNNQFLQGLLGMQAGVAGQAGTAQAQELQQLLGLNAAQQGVGQNLIANLSGIFGQQQGVLGQQSGMNLAQLQALAGIAGQGFQGDLAAGQFNQQSADMQAQTWQSMLQNGTLPIQFLIAAEAAKNAGQPGESSDNGGGGGGIISQLLRGL